MDYESRPFPRSYNPHPAEKCDSGWYVNGNRPEVERSARMVLDATRRPQAIHAHAYGSPCSRSCQVIRARKG